MTLHQSGRVRMRCVSNSRIRLATSNASAARSRATRACIVVSVLVSACRDGALAPSIDGAGHPAAVSSSVVRFDCTGSGQGVSCVPASGGASSASSALGASYDKIVGSPFAMLAQTAFDFGVSGANQLRSTVSLQNLTVQPFATTADYATYDGVGPKVFFMSGPTNTGGTTGAVTLLNASGTGTFTATNQAYYQYAEQIPANATNSTAVQWTIQLPGANTTFSFQVYVNVQLPDETTSLIIPAHTFTALALGSGANSQCGIRSGGTSYCWGRNLNGQLGEGTSTQRNTPSGVLGAGRSFTSIAQGYKHGCGITADGQIYCWGANASGQLGTTTNSGTTTPTRTPQAVPLPSGVASFSAVAGGQFHTCAIANTGRVYCWGQNTTGQLGTTTNSGTATPMPTPQAVALPSGVASFSEVSAGGLHTCAVANTGKVYCWGSNLKSQLGATANGTANPTPLAVPLPSGVTGFSSVAAGAVQTCALANTGQVYCWGLNHDGQLGTTTNNGTNTATPALQAVPLPSGVTSFSVVAAGQTHTCALANTGQVYCWGVNTSGQLGVIANGMPNPTPQAVPVPYGVASFSTIGLGALHSCALADTGEVYCWGNNSDGQLGNGPLNGNTNPTPALVSMP